MPKIFLTSLLILGALLAGCFLYLNRPLFVEIQPASFTCFAESDGFFLEQRPSVSNIYGIGLAYEKHINETASSFDRDQGPPVFKKTAVNLASHQSEVSIPADQDLRAALETIEPGIGETLDDELGELAVLLDYEVELGMILLQDISLVQLNDPDFIPPVGFFVANDLSARSLAVLGENQQNRYAYWGVSKSFPGFTPVGNQVWVPKNPRIDGIPCITLETRVNGTLRQHEMTHNLIYQPKEMLYFVLQNYPDMALKQGDIILTGTPGGVIFEIPRWKSRVVELLSLDRLQKLAISQRSSNLERFLKSGDKVTVSGDWLGEATITLR